MAGEQNKDAKLYQLQQRILSRHHMDRSPEMDRPADAGTIAKNGCAMARVELNLPPSAELLFNHLDPEMEAVDLGPDLVAIRLDSGSIIDVSWYPECDPDGHFTVTIVRDNWDNKEAEYVLREIGRVKAVIESLATEEPVEDLRPAGAASD